MVEELLSAKLELAQRLSDLKARLGNLKRDASQEHSSDSAEQAQERENDEVVDAIGIETRGAIAAVKAALLRIDEGSYGRCVQCGADIAPDRLKVRPEATHCIDCAS
ncbi:MAG: DnaK suppressor protein [Glaciecola sp.]|jgi:DnaK suppressor protein|uniref:TraR/DksA family transcriptional regulator n=1 Tax=Congregibacter sp. TaxID=2744308 RepID=UPI0039E4A5F4